MQADLEEIEAALQGLDPVGAIAWLVLRFPGQVTFSTSFGWEDQVITDMIFSARLPVRVFTLETGRLFPETYYVWNRTLENYSQPITAYYPDTAALEEMISTKGPGSFYTSVENRQECCRIRKIGPLNRALQGNRCWITGIRAGQSLNRTGLNQLEWDEQHQLLKFHPLFDWSLEEVKAYIRQHNVVYNPLHDKGFPSIGCAPCTRAVREGEDFRAGRWWWEDQSKKECGLHSTT